MSDGPAAATPVKVGEGAGGTTAVLFSALKSKHNCRDLAPARYGNDANKLLDAYGNRGGPLSAVATQVGALPPEQRAGALDTQSSHPLASVRLKHFPPAIRRPPLRRKVVGRLSRAILRLATRLFPRLRIGPS